MNSPRVFGPVVENSLNTGIKEYEIISKVNGITPIDTNCPGSEIAKHGMEISVIGDTRRKEVDKTARHVHHNIFATLSLSSKLDILAFFAFVLIYAIFNLIYFSKF